MKAMKNIRSAYVFYLKLLKEVYLVFGIYYKNSFHSGNIYRCREIITKKNWHILLGVHFLRVKTDQMTSSLEMRTRFSVDSFSLVLSKENVDRRVTLATSGIWYDICL